MEDKDWRYWGDLTEEEQLIEALHSTISWCSTDTDGHCHQNYSIKELLNFIQKKLIDFKDLIDYDLKQYDYRTASKEEYKLYCDAREVQWRTNNYYSPILEYFKDDKWQNVKVYDIINKKIKLLNESSNL